MSQQLRASLSATQEYLKTHSLDEFASQHGIRGKVDNSGHLILDYDQILVKWSEPYGYACRGLVLDSKTYSLLGFGLGKFFNAGEGYAAPINWDTARAYDKIDGSMVQRWWSPHTNQFEYTTRFQLPGDTAENTVGMAGLTWRQLMDKCFSGWDDILARQPRNETWVFEICSPANKVVVRQSGFSAKLLAIRNIETLVETDIETLDFIPAERKPKFWLFRNSKEVQEFADKFEGTEFEGCVVCDEDFNRNKFKNLKYLRLHRMKDGLNSIKNLIDLARTNDYEEVAINFPEYRGDLDLVANIINTTIAKHEVAYEQHRGIVEQKEFALTINKLGLEYTGGLFLTRAKKQNSVREAFANLEKTPFLKLFKDKVKKVLGDKYSEEIQENMV